MLQPQATSYMSVVGYSLHIQFHSQSKDFSYSPLSFTVEQANPVPDTTERVYLA